jgi:hypothetical protein
MSWCKKILTAGTDVRHKGRGIASREGRGTRMLRRNEGRRPFRKFREVWLFMNPRYGFLMWRKGLRVMGVIDYRVPSNAMPGVVGPVLRLGYV